MTFGSLRHADPKRYAWLLALAIPLSPFVAASLARTTGATLAWYLGPIVSFLALPLLDRWLGTDATNPPERVLEQLEDDRYYRWCTMAFLPLQYAGLIFACAQWASGTLSIADAFGLALTVGIVAGFAINAAHELGHKKATAERWLSRLALAQSGYGHFYVEHNRGHHVHVATPADPASARYGESFYAFWPRTVFGSLTSAWRIERRRYRQRGQHPFRLGNDVLNAWLMTVVLWGALIIWLGPQIVPYLLIQAIVGLTLLEAVNYLEHYGMLRQVVGLPGRERYERVDPSHSWNSNNIATNVLLYHLQRHSDHHAHPIRRYQALRDHPESPVLPTGYAGMILLALVPPAWRRVMDPRVLAHYGGDITLANTQASARDRRRAAAVAAREGSVGDRAVRAARCPGCGYVYDVERGDPREGFPSGTPWAAVPDDWCCPDCGVREKVDFVPVRAA